MGHPAHVHNFRYVIRELQLRGHQVVVCAWDKDVTLGLLQAFGLDYVLLGANRGTGIIGKTFGALKGAWAMQRVARKFRPDVFLSRVSPVSGLVSRLFRKPHVAFADTDFPHLTNTLALPMTDVVVTPQCFRKDLGRKQARIQSYKELAYLHPRYFTPDPAVLASEDLREGDPFSIVRFVSWQAAHDVGQGGFSREGRLRLVRELAHYGRVLVSAEKGIDPELADFAFRGPPHLMHHFLYYASVCVTEGGTMASECAVLGTPAICMNTLRAGLQTELQERYGLVFNYHSKQDEDVAIALAVEVFQQSQANREQWRARAARLVNDHIDMTEYLADVVQDCGRSR